MDAILPCEGADLKQLYEIKREAPEFYFKSLNESGSVKLKSIIVFNKCLEKLFN
jgi:hypothetical protein